MNTSAVHPLVTLIGSPNCGKTALFNALTGSRQKVANYSGVTVEKKEGVAVSSSGRRFRILDLPGSYSLNPASPDERVATEILMAQSQEEKAPEVILAVVDSTTLDRSLSLILELRDLGRPMILALNMIDLAQKRGQTLNSLSVWLSV